ncbi:TonB-dependent receptor [Haliea sp. E17]|uniref:TonB-dependent receptor n=1 Tax=Haliea sp. E17 TaxID=3401576 RepID=UPI003AAA2C34
MANKLNTSNRALANGVLAAAVAALTTGPVAAADGGTAFQLEEVVVTAQRRVENMQDVPVAVTAVSAYDMEMARVDSIMGIQQISPTIEFDVTNSAANSANILIRGIGTVGNSRAFEGAVGVFVDGVYRTRAGQAMQNWLDIDSLQILRGPQGTLFGKNTSAGALLLTSRAPTLDEMIVDYSIDVGSYDKRMVRGALNLPVGETMAVRVAGLWGEQEGIIDNPNGGEYNDRKPRALKAQFLFAPSDNFEAHLILDWSDEQNNCCYGQVDAVDGPTQPLIDALILARGKKLPSADFDDYEQVLSFDTDQQIEDQGAVLTLNWELPGGQVLNSVTGYRDWRIEQDNMDADFTGANIFSINEYLETEMFSQELTLSGDLDGFGPFDAADYVFGLYYADEDIDAGNQLVWGDQAQVYWDTLLGFQGLPPGIADATAGIWAESHMPASSKSYAAFMHWNLDFTERFGMNVGLRYSEDEKEGQMDQVYFTPVPNTVFTVLGVQPGPEYKDKFDDSALTGSLAFDYRFSDSLMAYVSYSRGYKSGGVNIDNTAAGTVANNPAITPGAIPEDPTYKSEFMDGYEIGFKADYLGGHARSNFAAFYNDIEDLQVAQFLGTRFSIDNAPDAEVYGFELENQLLLSESFTLEFDVVHLAEAKFGNDPIIGNLADREFARAPDWASNLALNMDQPLGDNLALFGRVGLSYKSEIYTNTSNDFKEDDQTTYTATLGLRSMSGVWSVSAWCQNCSDERFVTQHFNSPLQSGDANAYVYFPRTYGLTLRGSF